MKAAIVTRLKRLEQVQATENPPPAEFQIGYLKTLPAEYAGDRHIVTVGRDADGTYEWEERRGRRLATKVKVSYRPSEWFLRPLRMCHHKSGGRKQRTNNEICSPYTAEAPGDCSGGRAKPSSI